jgi:signal transduction histidine kinase
VRSLKGKLGLGLALSLTAIIALQWWLASYTLHEVTEEYIRERLQQDVDMLLAAVTFDSAGQIELKLEQQTYFDDRPFSGHYYRIETAATVLRSPTLWDQDLPVAAAAPGQQQRRRLTGPLEQPLLVLVQGFRKQGHDVSIAVAEDLTVIEQRITAFQRSYLLLSIAFLILLLILQRLLLGRALAPLKDVQQDLQGLARGETTSVRETVPIEIQPLVREVNRLLQLLSQRVERSRRMVGNLAHALKTPLTVLTRTTEHPALKALPELREQLETQTEAIRERLERELSRARLAGSANTGARFDPAQDLPALLELLRTIYADRGIELTLHSSEGPPWPAEREDMLELAGNLIDNACKWACEQVIITVEPAPRVSLIVEDDGPGCPPALREGLAQRGLRLDEHREGHGLGLDIVRNIVEHYNGELELTESRLGGLQVRVVLPER